MSVLLLADLHLPAQPSSLRNTFIAFLEGPARRAESVYLLGDLFEYWIGDVEGLQVYAREAESLVGLTASGVRVFVQHGNRDFLLGRQFERATGVKLLPDPCVVDLGGERWLLSHGDAWCTDDVGYQRWRRFSRAHWAQRSFLLLPARWRERIAGGLRGGSTHAKADKSPAIMDVNDAAVRRDLKDAGVGKAIHGHTHRPADHVLPMGSTSGERVVLADWREDRREYLEIKGKRRRRVNLA